MKRSLLAACAALWWNTASAVPEYGCPANPTWNAVPCSMHRAMIPYDGRNHHITHVLSRSGDVRDYMVVLGESAARIRIYPHFEEPGWVAGRVARAWAAQPEILRRAVMPLIIGIDYAGPVYWDYREGPEAAHIIEFPAAYVHEGARTLDWSFEELLTHEMCHAIDKRWSLRYRDGWEDAVRRDRTYVTDYARSSAAEDFAESCAAFVLARTSTRLTDAHLWHIERTMSYRWEWLERLFSLRQLITPPP